MSVPWTLSFEVAFDVDPADEPVSSDWTDLTERLWGGADIDVSSGGMTDTARLTLLDQDGHLDPSNEASPYNPIGMRHARLRATVGSTTYPVFRGYVKSFVPQWGEFNEALSAVTLVNAAAWMATRDEDVDLPRTLTHNRITSLLDLADWPAGRRDIADGVVWVNGYDQQDANLLRVLSDTADAEDGEFYVSPSGDVVFRSRHSRFDSEVAATFAIFGDGTVDEHDVAVAGIRLAPGLDQVINVGRVELDNGSTYRFKNLDSITNFGELGGTVRDLTLGPHEAMGVAQWMVVRYGDEYPWIDSLSVDGRRDGAMPLLLEMGKGDRVRFLHNRPGGGQVDLDVCVESVRHRIGNDTWMATFSTEPYFGEGPWGVWLSAEAAGDPFWLSDVATTGPRWAP